MKRSLLISIVIISLLSFTNQNVNVEPVKSIHTPTFMGAKSVVDPLDITSDQIGNIYVSTANNRVYRFSNYENESLSFYWETAIYPYRMVYLQGKLFFLYGANLHRYSVYGTYEALTEYLSGKSSFDLETDGSYIYVSYEYFTGTYYYEYIVRMDVGFGNRLVYSASTSSSGSSTGAVYRRYPIFFTSTAYYYEDASRIFKATYDNSLIFLPAISSRYTDMIVDEEGTIYGVFGSNILQQRDNNGAVVNTLTLNHTANAIHLDYGYLFISSFVDDMVYIYHLYNMTGGGFFPAGGGGLGLPSLEFWQVFFIGVMVVIVRKYQRKRILGRCLDNET